MKDDFIEEMEKLVLCLTKEFIWNSINDIPKYIEEPILCLTDNGKLMTFKNTKTIIYPNTTKSGFGHLVEKYKIKLWVYQKELLPNEIANVKTGDTL